MNIGASKIHKISRNTFGHYTDSNKLVDNFPLFLYVHIVKTLKNVNSFTL
jgi:hypothetical protein